MKGKRKKHTTVHCCLGRLNRFVLKFELKVLVNSMIKNIKDIPTAPSDVNASTSLGPFLCFSPVHSW